MAGQISDKLKQKRRDAAMKMQHNIAAEISKSFVGKTIRVLVEKAASATEIQNASVSSWEHGLIREKETHHSSLATRHFLVRSWRGGRAGH